MADVFSNELLMQALERAVLAGKLEPKGVKFLYNAYAKACEIDPKENQVFLSPAPGAEALPLDEAVAAIIADNEFLKPKQPVRTEADEIKALEDAAATGSVTAHGNLFKRVGETKYNEWCAKTKAKPGKDVAPGLDPIEEMQARLNDLRRGRRAKPPASGGVPEGADNPWSAGGWNITRQGAYVREHGEAKALEAAQAAGLTSLGATKPAVAA